MIYAPIIIPTLNRINHFKRCIDSLQKNSWADKTEIYISVDFPPETKYIEGYNEICQFLSHKVHGFLNVHIFFQEKNLGPVLNSKFLIDTVEKKYDRYIFLEDDVEVSKNFIEFMDNELERNLEKNEIYAVCACGAGMENGLNAIVKSLNYSAWGVGIWIDKQKRLNEIISYDYFLELFSFKNVKKIGKIVKEGSSLVFSLQDIVFDRNVAKHYRGRYAFFDQSLKIYGLINNMYVSSCTLRKARNWGYDGSGVNCLDLGLEQSLDILIDNAIFFEGYIIDDDIIMNGIEKIKGINGYLRMVLSIIKMYAYSFFKQYICKN